MRSTSRATVTAKSELSEEIFLATALLRRDGGGGGQAVHDGIQQPGADGLGQDVGDAAEKSFYAS